MAQCVICRTQEVTSSSPEELPMSSSLAPADDVVSEVSYIDDYDGQYLSIYTNIYWFSTTTQ